MGIWKVNIHHGEQSRDNRRDASDYGCHIGKLLAGASHVSYLGDPGNEVEGNFALERCAATTLDRKIE